MAKVKFTSALKPFFPSLTDLELQGRSIRELLDQIETRYPGISGYLTDETGSLRKHVNIFLQGDLIKDRNSLSDLVKSNDEVIIFQALSGG
jgi:molybdopterin converting factor small subunit